MVFPLLEMAYSDFFTAWQPIMNSSGPYLILKQFKPNSIVATWSLIQRNIYQHTPHPTWISLCPSHVALLSVAYIHHVLATKAIKTLIWITKLFKHLEENVGKYLYNLRVRKNVLKKKRATHTNTHDLIKTKNFCTWKINRKHKPQIGNKIFATPINNKKALDPKHVKNSYKSMRERQTIQYKNGQKTNRHFTKRVKWMPTNISKAA